MVKAGLSVPQALGMTFTAYAGSAQLAVLPLLAVGAPLWVVFFTAVLVNLRFVVYSMTVRDVFAPQTAPRRLGLGYLIGDIVLVKFLAFRHNEPQSPHHLRYFVTGATFNWLVWQVASVIGILAADSIPLDWGLELAGTLALLALVVPACAQWPPLAGVATAALLSVVTFHWPMKLGLLAAVAGGVAVALLFERRAA